MTAAAVVGSYLSHLIKSDLRVAFFLGLSLVLGRIILDNYPLLYRGQGLVNENGHRDTGYLRNFCCGVVV